MAKKTEFTFEVEETITLKQGGKLIAGYCPKCDANVDLVSPYILALISGASEREIFRLVEAGSLHFEEGERLTVCSTCFELLFQSDRATEDESEINPVGSLLK